MVYFWQKTSLYAGLISDWASEVFAQESRNLKTSNLVVIFYFYFIKKIHTLKLIDINFVILLCVETEISLKQDLIKYALVSIDWKKEEKTSFKNILCILVY